MPRSFISISYSRMGAGKNQWSMDQFGKETSLSRKEAKPDRMLLQNGVGWG